MGRTDGTDVHSSDVKIELRPHIGKHCRLGHHVEHDQWIVLATVGEYFGHPKPRQIGYLKKANGSKFAPIYEFQRIAKFDREQVLKQISAAAGWEVGSLKLPSTVTE